MKWLQKDTINTIDNEQQAENCRTLFLSVINQAILDSGKKNKMIRRDLPQVIKSDWWRQLFIFAGVENELEKVNKIIISNCINYNKKQYEKIVDKRRYYRVQKRGYNASE